MKVTMHFNYWRDEHAVGAADSKCVVISRWTVGDLDFREGTVTLLNDGPFLTVQLIPETPPEGEIGDGYRRSLEDEARKVRILAERVTEAEWLSATDAKAGLLVLAVSQLELNELPIPVFDAPPSYA